MFEILQCTCVAGLYSSPELMNYNYLDQVSNVTHEFLDVAASFPFEIPSGVSC